MSLFRKDPAAASGKALFYGAVTQARAPVFYAEFGVPDTVEGRFEMIALHVYLLLRRLKDDGAAAKKISQQLTDAMFQNMDDSLRELGVGDLSVARKIRKMAENFYGRIAAYEAALDADPGKLSDTISKNVYGKEDAPHAGSMAEYMRSAADKLSTHTASEICNGNIPFPVPENRA